MSEFKVGDIVRIKKGTGATMHTAIGVDYVVQDVFATGGIAVDCQVWGEYELELAYPPVRLYGTGDVIRAERGETRVQGPVEELEGKQRISGLGVTLDELDDLGYVTTLVKKNFELPTGRGAVVVDDTTGVAAIRAAEGNFWIRSDEGWYGDVDILKWPSIRVVWEGVNE